MSKITKSVLSVFMLALLLSVAGAAAGDGLSLAAMKSGIGRALAARQQELVITLSGSVEDTDVYKTVNEAFDSYYQAAYALVNYNLSIVGAGGRTTVKFKFTYDSTKVSEEVWNAPGMTGFGNAVYMIVNGRFTHAVIYVSGSGLLSDELNSFTARADSIIDSFIYGRVDSVNSIDVKEATMSTSRAHGVKNDKRGYYAVLDIKYNQSRAQYAEALALLRPVAEQLRTENKNDADCVRAIDAHVTSSYSYRDDGDDLSHSAYGMVTRGTGVCQAYASVCQIMYEFAGIKSRIVTGRADGVEHAWNMVRIGGTWLHVDSTYNDPVPDTSGSEISAYTLVSGDVISKDHTWDAASFTDAENDAYISRTALYRARNVALTIGSGAMRVDNVEMSVDFGRTTVPTAINSRTLIPIRTVAEALGGFVSWNSSTNEIVIILNGSTMKMYPGNKSYTFNGETKQFDVAPAVINNRTMMPARAVFEAFGYSVGWEASANRVTISI